MRTKTLLLTAVALAAGLTASTAQTVYSQNVVGYVNVPIQGATGGKYSLIANPLDAGNNTISNVVQNPADGATFFFWNGHGYSLSQFAFGSWDSNATNTVPPGVGIFVQTAGNFTNTYTGTVLQSNSPNSSITFPAGYSIISSQFPVNGDADSLGLTAKLADGDVVYKWNYAKQGFDLYQWAFGAWSCQGVPSSAPTLNPGESAFLSSQHGGTWTNNFTVQ
jgi:hypothetical protein